MTNCLKNPYAFIDADVMKVVDESSNIKTFTLKPRESISFRAGQFMEVTLPGIGEAPFTPSSNHNSAKTLDFTIMSAGRVTKLLHQAKAGDVIGLRGPYGTQYPLDKFKGREVFIVGGGVGLAPLRALLYALFNEVGDYKKII
ncbi:MAG: oxidoreductase, partial [Candidatus Omnitrophica bacterium]|nr:oxidoreductase [Candidatus Omnitrophota bacterium]